MCDLVDALLDEPLARQLRLLPLPEGDLGLDQALAAYRRSRISRQARRRTIRLAMTSVFAGVLSVSGVAAAYAASLPQPVQRVAHHLLGPLGVPAPRERPVHRIVHREEAHREPVMAPTTPSTPSEAARHPATPGRRAGAAVVDVDRSQILFGAPVHISVTATPRIAGARLQLLARVTGGAWYPVRPWTSTQRFDVVVEPRANTEFLVEIRLGRGITRTQPTLVQVAPVVTAHAVMKGSRWDITMHALGARAGEVVQLDRVGAHRTLTLARAVVDRDGVAHFTIAPPPRGDSYAVVVPATARHARVAAVVSTTSRD